MENNIDLKALWTRQPVPGADKEALLVKLSKLRAEKRRSLIWANVCLIPTALFVVWVWVYYQPEYTSTKVGIVLVVTAIAMFLIVSNKLIPLYKALNTAQLNSTYLDDLLQIRQREQFIQTTITNLYFLMLSAGLMLYLYEYASRMGFTGMLISYAITAGWIAFNWFYFRPKQINKNRQKIDGIIRHLQEIKNQLAENPLS